MESRLPIYKQEKSDTNVCPFPEEVQEERRRLATRVYRYKATGRCRRCRNRTTARGRLLQANKVCSISIQMIQLRDEATYVATTVSEILESTRMKAAGGVIPDVEATTILNQADHSARQCQEQSAIMSRAEERVTRLCVEATRLRSTEQSAIMRVETEYEASLILLEKMKAALSFLRKSERYLNSLEYIQKVKNKSLIERRDRDLQEKEICNYS